MPARRSKGSIEPESELGPLPGGHHGLSREQVAESQRERLIAGIAVVVGEQGYRGATITMIVKEASVSSRAFYEVFDSKEECFLAAFDAVVEHLHTLLGDAAASYPDWPHRLIAALRTGLDFLAAEPNLARLCVVEPVAASPAIAGRFRDAVVDCVPFLKQGRAEHSGEESLPDSTEDSLMGGLIVLVSQAINIGPGATQELLPDLVEFVLAPYLGAGPAKLLAAESAAPA